MKLLIQDNLGNEVIIPFNKNWKVVIIDERSI